MADAEQVASRRGALSLYNRRAKRLIDFALALPAFCLVLPVMGMIAVLVRLTMGAPVIFHQERSGKDGKPFSLYKFRTMTEKWDEIGKLLPDEDRVTALGRFLRSTSVDELLGLLNVIRGDMSLVGPRPLLVKYLERYTAAQRRRNEIRPGITGWAQVQGRNSVTWEKRLADDVWYVDNMSPLLDLRILFLTIWKTLKRDGVSPHDQLTMPEFKGDSDSYAHEEPSIRSFPGSEIQPH